MFFVERRSKRAIHRLTGGHRDTITRALESEVPPKYLRPATASKVDPFKEWMCEQLQADASIQSLRLREMAGELGYEGGKSIFETVSARSVRGSSDDGRFSARSIGRVSWCPFVVDDHERRRHDDPRRWLPASPTTYGRSARSPGYSIRPEGAAKGLPW